MMQDYVQEHAPNLVHAWIGRKDGKLEDLGISENLRTTVGADWQSNVMGADTQPVAAQFIALTTNSAAPAAGDTTLATEITTGGLGRAEGAYTHTNGTTSYKISYTFTASATHTAVAKAGMFTAITAGTMVFTTLLSSTATLASGDTLTIEWSVNL